MTDIADLVEAFKREVAIPGAFSQQFPTVTDQHVVGCIADGFAEAQLDGFFHSMALDLDAETITPDLSAAGAALVLSYAGARVVRQKVLAEAAGLSLKAGPVGYERTPGVSVLQEMLKQLERRKQQIVEQARAGGVTTFMIDGYRARANGFYGGFAAYEAYTQPWRF